MGEKFRNAKGHFTSIEKQLKLSEPIFGNKGKIEPLNINELKSKAQDAVRKGLDASPQSGKDEYEKQAIQPDEILSPKEFEERYPDHKPEWTKFKKENQPIKEKPVNLWKHADGEIRDYPEFKYSYKVQQILKYNEAEQKKLYELFRMANQKVEQIKKFTNNDIGREFSYNLEVSAEALERRINAAEKVIKDTYLQDIGVLYKNELIDNFKEFIEETELMDRLETAVKNLTALEFLQILQTMGKTVLAYALESYIDENGYDMLIREVEYMIDRFETKDMIVR